MLFLALLAIAFAATYFFIKRAYTYWDRIGIKSIPPSFPFGNLGDNIKQKLSIGQLVAKIYQNTSERCVGIYCLFRPTLLLCDPELIRNVCGRDFKYFYHRGYHFDEENDPTVVNLFFTNGERWKNLREKLSPTFTSGKLRGMFDTIVGCGKSVQEYMDQYADTNEAVEVREIFAQYTTNIIASVGFGLDVDCIKNPNNEFRRQGMSFFETNLRNTIRQFMRIVSPTLCKLFKIRTTNRDVQKFMTAIVKQNAEYRDQNNIVRKDFFQLLLDLHRSGSVQLDDEWKTVLTSKTSKPLTLDEITASAIIFFLAAFETSSTTMTFCLYELAKNVEIQRKVQEEIDAVGEITYESIEKMKYLENCIDGKFQIEIPVAFDFTRDAIYFQKQCENIHHLRSFPVNVLKTTKFPSPISPSRRELM